MNDREDGCWLCGNPTVHKHHVYGGTGRRQVSEREGCYVYLCPAHHNMSSVGVHFDHQLDMRLKAECERRWLEANGATEADFIRTFGRNYL